jgi:N-acetylglucosaminyldiphosphoundecaprenol N-acetyl-beta-D-mannosaminyltransferase
MVLKQFIGKLPGSLAEVYNKIEQTVITQSKSRLYSIDLTNFSTAFFDNKYLRLLENSEIHCVDSSWLPLLLKYKFDIKINHSSLTAVFDTLIVNENYRHLILGGPKSKLEKFASNPRFSKTNMHVYELPFAAVNEFDYQIISGQINNGHYDFIWVSLGAPKQEMFIEKLFPHINKGVICGCGYIIDIYSGIKRAPLIIQKLRLEWVFRLLQNPKKQSPRILLIIRFIFYFFQIEKK